MKWFFISLAIAGLFFTMPVKVDKMKRLIFIFLLILAPGWAFGADYTVCSSGCTSTTLSGLLGSVDVNPGDIVELRADTAGGTKTFTDTALISSDDEGSSESRVIYQGREGDTIVFNKTGLTDEAGIVVQGDYVTVKNIKVMGASGYYGGGILATGAPGFIADDVEVTTSRIGIYITGSIGSEVKNSRIYLNERDGSQAADGVRVYSTSTGTIVHDNIIYSNTEDGIEVNGCEDVEVYDNLIYSNAAQGVYSNATSSGTIIKGNIIYSNVDHNILSYSTGTIISFNNIHGAVTSSNIKVENTSGPQIYTNIIYSSTETHYGIQLNDTTGGVVYNNTLYENGYGIGLKDVSTGSTIKNNIIMNSIGVDLIVDAASVTDTVIDYNNFYRSSGNIITYNGTTYTTAEFATYKTSSSQDSNSVLSDPLFTNAAGGDFTLKPNSPAIDAGTPLWTYYEPCSETNANCYVQE